MLANWDIPKCCYPRNVTLPFYSQELCMSIITQLEIRKQEQRHTHNTSLRILMEKVKDPTGIIILFDAGSHRVSTVLSNRESF